MNILQKIKQRILDYFYKCKFYKTCRLYDPTNPTCTRDGGGSYCGEWRSRQAWEKTRVRKSEL